LGGENFFSSGEACIQLLDLIGQLCGGILEQSASINYLKFQIKRQLGGKIL